MKVEDISKLKSGDVIYFHNWGVGGFLFGIIIRADNNELKVWRARSKFCIDDIDAVELIKSAVDTKGYLLHDLQDIINDAKANNIDFNLVI